ncbi:helix-turn-helix transcriptional regulator [Geothermobacter hydrogeniphilus]|uniref:Transcriptional regulator n=1 Tax=Geothermobacter hydrogeniphilus TaxID=1969733 RepID=A0A1X0XXK5_9BACT|nr:helix-turn-helix transcriptional regulator [Geothermobacter hydrogeniphilus]ORJ57586.1 transcriptional regulator [Geothermobacter hydrogeniphilus]
MSKTRAFSRHTREAINYLAVQIKSFRKQRGWSERELAERAGISRATLQKIEAGDPGCSLGLVFEVATLVGLPLFETDTEQLAARSNLAKQTLSLLPKRIRSNPREVSDDF